MANRRLGVLWAAFALVGGLLPALVPAPASAGLVGGSISGTVWNVSNAELEGIGVFVYVESGDDFVFYTSAQTASDGTYHFDLAADTYKLRFVDFDSVYAPHWFNGDLGGPTPIGGGIDVDSATPVPVSGVPVVLDAVMVESGAIAGNVVDFLDNGLDGVVVTAYSTAGSFQSGGITDSAGDYSISGLPPGNYELALSVSGAPASVQLLDGTVTVVAGATTPGADAVLETVGAISGTVEDSIGNGLAGILVTAYTSSDFFYGASASTDSNGDYTIIGLPAGTYSADFSDPTLVHSVKTLSEIVVEQSALTSVDTVLEQAGGISGTVVDTLATGLQGIVVTAYSNWTPIASTQTDVNGDYSLGGLAPGSYQVAFGDPNRVYASHWIESVSVSSGTTTTGVDATLQPAGSISGRVTDQAVEPLEGTWVEAVPVDFSTAGASAFADEFGDYTLTGLDPGLYLVKFAPPCCVSDLAWQWWEGVGSQAAASPVTVVSDETTGGIDAVLPPGASISGTVLGEVEGDDPAPVSGLEVHLLDTAGNFASVAWTDVFGDYTISGLPAGSYIIEFPDYQGFGYAREWYDGSPTMSSATIIELGEAEVLGGVDAVLSLPASITGLVMGEVIGNVPAPISGASVSVEDEFGSGMAFAVTDGAGEFVAEGLHPLGAYRVSASSFSTDHALRYFDGKTDLASADEVLAGTDIELFLPLRDAPALVLPDDITVEATGPSGAVVEFSTGAVSPDNMVWEHLVFSYAPASLTRNPKSYNDHLEFRRAVAHALDFDRIIAEVPGAAVRLDSHFDAYVSGLSSGGWSVYDFNPTVAEGYLDDLCAKGGVDCEASPPTVVFTTTLGNAGREAFADLLEEMLEAVGIAVVQELEPSATFFGSTLDTGGFDLGSWAWVGTPSLDALASIHDIVDPDSPWPSGNNASRYGSAGSRLIDDDSARVGELIDLMATAANDAELEGYLEEMEGILVDQVVFIPLWIRGDGTAECTYESGDTFPIGVTVVNCSASRGLGTKVSNGSFNVTVEDTTAPVITAPNRYVETTNPLGRSVTYTVSALDAVDGAVVATCDPVSGSTFAQGSHTVDCTAEDAAGNVAAKSFTVTVFFIDDEDPPAVTSSVSSPVEGVVTVVTEAAGPDPVGYELLGTKVVITAPAAESVDAPLVLEFVIAAASIPDGVGVNDVVVFRNGVAVTACTGAPSAIPDPCVSSRVVVGGDFVITVLTTAASDWEFGIALDEDPDPDPSVVRYAGANRFATAVEISKADFPDPGLVSLVFVAVGNNFPDALAGSAAAAALGAPLLLVNTGAIPDVTAAELTRLDPDTIVVLGGTAVISPGVATDLGAWGTVVRLAGANRYATAAAISLYAFDDPSAVDEVIVATGSNFPDALGGGPVAAAVGGPVLLVPPSGVLPAEIAAELTRLDPERITVLGGESAVSSGVFTQLGAFADTVVRKSGANRYATAIEASKHGFGSAVRVYVAVGTNFPDALAGAAAAGFYDAPVLLVPSGSLPPEVAAEITRLGATKVIILGGTGVVSTTVENALRTLLGL